MIWIKPNNVENLINEKTMHPTMFIRGEGKLIGNINQLLLIWQPKSILAGIFPFNGMTSEGTATVH